MPEVLLLDTPLSLNIPALLRYLPGYRYEEEQETDNAPVARVGKIINPAHPNAPILTFHLDEKGKVIGLEKPEQLRNSYLTVLRHFPEREKQVFCQLCGISEEDEKKFINKNIQSQISSLLPAYQDCLINAMKSLGYPSDKNGVCYGFSHMAMQALLTNEFDIFLQRLNLLGAVSGINSKIEKIKEKKINGEELTPYDYRLLDAQAFLEGMELYQNSYRYGAVFGWPTEKQDWAGPGALLSPRKLDEESGISKVTTFTGIYTQPELEKYFKALSESLKDSASPVAFILENRGHAISVGFVPGTPPLWQVVDINQKIQQTDDLHKVSEIVFEGLSGSLSNPHSSVAFVTHAYCALPALAEVQKELMVCESSDLWQEIHAATLEKLMMIDEKGMSWLQTAAFRGDLAGVKKLIEAGDDINQSSPPKGATPLCRAILKNEKEVVEFLLSRPNIGINDWDNDGYTPLHYAVGGGIDRREVVALLLSMSNLQVNQPDKDGLTPLHYAVKAGLMEVVALLLKHKDIDIHAVTSSGQSVMSLAQDPRIQAMISTKLHQEEAEQAWRSRDLLGGKKLDQAIPVANALHGEQRAAEPPLTAKNKPRL